MNEWGWCEYCSTGFVMESGKLPTHYRGGNPSSGICDGSNIVPRRLVRDNQLVENENHD